MKNYKKIATGLIFLIAAVGFSIFLTPQKASAATLFDAQRCEKTLKFIDIAHIQCQTSSDTVTFVDMNPTDQWAPVVAKRDYFYNIHYSPNGVFCGDKNFNVVGGRGLNDAKYRFGLSLTDEDVEEGVQVRHAGKSLRYKLNVGYTEAGSTDCKRYGGDGGKNGSITETARIKYLVRFNSKRIAPLAGVTDGSLSEISYSLVEGYNDAPIDEQGRQRGSILAFTDGNYQNCTGNLIIIKTSNRARDSAAAISYELKIKKDSSGINKSQYPEVYDFFVASNVVGCNVTAGPLNRGVATTNQSFMIAGIPPSTDNSGVAAGVGATDSDSTCEASSDSALNWLMCPVFKIAEAAANGLLNLFQSQLCFRTDTADTGSGAVCESFGDDPEPQTLNTSEIKPAWSAIKNIVSALLVIIMLLAIISQAFSIGPFDAYTVRKLLPKIVIAVILIQLSWYIFNWIVNLVDDMGAGLFNLFSNAFPDDINHFGKLLDNAGINDKEAFIGNWLILLPGLVILGAAALPLVLFSIVAAIFALLVGIAVLIFRKILIVTLLILAPVALILWILPTTEKYWKSWWDNFLKVLLMYPLIVLIIEAGRIFAWVGAKTTGSELLGFFVVVIGFFGPLFILPKTYKWGGSIMQATGNVMAGMAKPATEKAGGLARGVGERWQGKRANMLDYNRRGTRATLARGLRRVQSGHMLPLSKRSRNLAVQTGAKWAAEEGELATNAVENAYNTGLIKDYTARNGRTYTAGVEAAKAAIADLTRSRDERIGRAASIKLVGTASWPEIQSFTDEHGRKVFEDNQNWNTAAARDPDTYRSVLSKRTDAASHIIEMADQAARGRRFVSPAAELEFKSAYRMQYAIERQMSNEDFAGESDGFWEEAARLAATNPAVRNALITRFTAIHATGGTYPSQMLGHLANGGQLQANVEAALGHGVGGLARYL